MDKENRPNREELRDDPSSLWEHLDNPEEAFRGGEAKQGVAPEAETMSVASGFSEAGSSIIDPHKWELYFREKDKGVNKDETYYRKVMQAIATWNNLSPSERATYLSTGQYTDSITEDLISTLTSGRIIDMHKKPTFGGGGGGGGGHFPGGGGHYPGGGGHFPGGGGHFRGGEHLPGGEHSRSNEGLRRRFPFPWRRIMNIPKGTPENGVPGGGMPSDEIPESEIPSAIPGGEISSSTPSGEVPGGEIPSSTPSGEVPSGRMPSGEIPESETPSTIPGGEMPSSTPSGEMSSDGMPEGETPSTIPGGEIPGGEISEDEIPSGEVSGDEDETPSNKPEKEEDEETEGEKVYVIIKVVKKEELPPEEQEAVEETVRKETNKVIGALKRSALLAVLTLALLKNPIDQTNIPAEQRIVATSQHEEETQYPGREYEREMTEEERQELVEKLLRDCKLGDTIEAPSGLVLHRSSDYQYVVELGGEDVTVTIGESEYRAEGEYTMDRISFTERGGAGPIIASYHYNEGDRGSFQDLLEETREKTGYEGQIGIHVHLDGPNGGIELSGQTGWTEDFASVFVPEGTTITEQIPSHYEHYTVTDRYTSQGEIPKDGTIKLKGENGKEVFVNILNPDGTYRKHGDTIIGSDGCAYQIESIAIQEGTTEHRLNLLKLAHDIAMIGIAGTGIAIAMSGNRKREGEPEDSSAETNTEGGGTGSSPELETKREYMELNGEQLVRLTKIFTERTGDRAPEIAKKFAEKAGIEIPEQPNETESVPSETSGEAESDEQTVFDQMTDAEMLLAQALLIKHDEVTLRELSEEVGFDLEEYANLILNGAQETADEATNQTQEETQQ
ncbi:hypothetical protein IKQ74_02925 [Candidatus Saccharibacteria bacterium]|nr:hypothetical protein [Candidatus Saccharibacteria bacterium]